MRLFNALNGEEVKEIVLNDLRNQMELDETFRQHLTYPLIEWKIEVKFTIHGDAAQQFAVGSTGQVKVKQSEPVVLEINSERKVMAPIDGEAPDTARESAGLPILTAVDTPVGRVDAPAEQPKNAFDALLGKKRR